MAGAARRTSAGTARAGQANLRRILNANADGVVVVDRDGVVCFANPAAEQLFGRAAGDLVGDVFGFPLAAGATTELDVPRRGGEPFVVEMRVVAIDWEGEPAYLASLRDITDRRRAEQERAERVRVEVARAEAEAAVRARDAFLAVAAHELKTPLTRVTLAVQGAQRRRRPGEATAPAPARPALRLVEREVAHLSRLVRQLLDAARIESGTVVPRRRESDLGPLVRRAVAAAEAAADGHELSVRVPAEPVAAEVDAALLETALADVVASALRYTPPGTAIEVELGPVEGGRAQVTVRDHGPPVPPDVRAALAAARLPAEEASGVPGSGVALHLMRLVAGLHGGNVALAFPEEGGTSVVVSAPAISERLHA